MVFPLRTASTLQPAAAAASPTLDADAAGRSPIDRISALVGKGGSTTLRCSLPTTAASRTPPCPRQGTRAASRGACKAWNQTLSAAQTRRSGRRETSRASRASRRSAANANADALNAAASAAADAAAAAQAAADIAARNAALANAAARDEDDRASRHSHTSPPPSPRPLESPPALPRRSARLAAARAARDDVDSDGEGGGQESANGSAAASSTRGELDFITEVLRIDGDEDDVYQPVKQITVKEAAGIPILYGATGAGQNREVQPIAIWLRQFVRYMQQCGVKVPSDFCHYATLAVKPASEAAAFVAGHLAAGTWPHANFKAAYAVINDHFVPITAIDTSLQSLLSLRFEAADTATTYGMRIRNLSQELKQLHRRLINRANRDGHPDSIPDLVDCIALQLAERGLPAAYRERLSLQTSRRFLLPEFTKRLDEVLRQVDISSARGRQGRTSVNTVYHPSQDDDRSQPHDDRQYRNRYGYSSGSSSSAFNGGSSSSAFNGGSSSSGGFYGDSSGGNGGGSGSNGGTNGGNNARSTGGGRSGGNGRHRQRGGRNSGNRNGNDQQQDGTARAQPPVGLPRQPPEFPPPRRTANAVAPATQSAVPAATESDDDGSAADHYTMNLVAPSPPSHTPAAPADDTADDRRPIRAGGAVAPLRLARGGRGAPPRPRRRRRSPPRYCLRRPQQRRRHRRRRHWVWSVLDQQRHSAPHRRGHHRSCACAAPSSRARLAAPPSTPPTARSSRATDRFFCHSLLMRACALSRQGLTLPAASPC